jgi:hypothetical protein
MQRKIRLNRRSYALKLLVSCCCLVALVAAATADSASSAAPAKTRPNDECQKGNSRPDVTVLARTSSRVPLRGSVRTRRNTWLMTARPSCGGAMLACWADSEHFARASLHANGSVIYGYWAYYGRTGGYELGNHNNEIVFTGHGIAHYASPDWGPPGMWHYRDAPDLYVGPGSGVHQYLIYHAFDRQWAGDDACTNTWYF